MKFPPVEAELFHAEGQTGIFANSRFSQILRTSLNIYIIEQPFIQTVNTKFHQNLLHTLQTKYCVLISTRLVRKKHKTKQKVQLQMLCRNS